MMGWQWQQLDHMQIIHTSLQTDNHASTSPLSFHRPDALPATQPTASEHWRQGSLTPSRSGNIFSASKSWFYRLLWWYNKKI